MAVGRPNMVRADTIDLQDQDAPTAADHHKHIESDSIAPHQASQFQHVQEERRSEEETLADAWNMAGQQTQEHGGNGQAGAEADKKQDGTDAANGEGEDGTDGEDEDDDMMDRMSSSPSIEDGAFTHEGQDTPQHTERNWETFNQSPSPTPPDSSPFAETPRHMPLRLGTPPPLGVETLEAVAEAELSPSIRTPEISPILATAMVVRAFPPLSERHRLYGRSRSGSGTSHNSDDSGFGEDEHGVRSGSPTRPKSKHRRHLALDSVPIGVRGNAFAQQRTPDAELGTFEQTLPFRNKESTDTPLTFPSIDELMLQRFSLVPCDNNGWETDSSEDLTEQDIKDDEPDAFLDLDDRFIDSGWGGECLRETEDIDFEFVYALHTFVATVEGQANATKGDTMVLLDDSNSYWWLVRVVKDSSIGYLPAEHIETPTERLARLNKHRNIDLSQTMLGDNPEKTRNPLKKAMRRRTAKTVQFAAPTYVEASDYDYSSDEEDGMIDPYSGASEPQQEQVSERGQPVEVEERNAPEEANVHATRRFSGESLNAGKASLDSIGKTSMDSKRSSIDDPQLSPKLIDRTEAAPLKSRKGTPRNADSFLKDDSMETRKISLTPGLLRDDSGSVAKSSSTESTRNDSFEQLVKTPSPQEERKKDPKDKKKDKKAEKKQGGMLSGLFKSKKKDKKTASRDEGELSDMEKGSAELSRGSPQSSTTALTGNVSPVERMTGPANNQPQARAKLQKAPPSDGSSRIMSPVQESPQQAKQVQQVREPQHPSGAAFVAELEGSNAAYEMATGQEDSLPIQQHEVEVPPPVQEKSGPLSPIAAILRTGSTSGEPKPKKAKRSKQRVELDDFDEEPEEEDESGPNPFMEQANRSRQDSQDSDRLSASPVEITSPTSGTFMHGTESIHIPQMNVDSDDEDEEPTSLNASDSHSTSTDPSFIEKPTEQQPAEESVLTKGPESATTREAPSDNDLTPTTQKPQPAPPTPITTSTTEPTTAARDTTSTPSPSSSNPSTASAATAETPISSSPQHQQQQRPEWDDAGLRAWFDADDVKDMLAIIHNTKHDAAVGDKEVEEHPAMQGLFSEQRKGVEGMMGELDGLLGGLLQRKGVVFT